MDAGTAIPVSPAGGCHPVLMGQSLGTLLRTHSRRHAADQSIGTLVNEKQTTPSCELANAKAVFLSTLRLCFLTADLAIK